MKSNFERDNFKKLYWLVGGILLMLSIVLLVLIGMGADSSTKIALIMIGVTEVLSLVMLYILSMRAVNSAYDAVENASDMMKSLTASNGEMEGIEAPGVLREGSVGILYDNFEKLVDMFREGRNREQREKEYLKDVMSDISHQLKTPLASMNVFIDLLVNDKVSTEDEKKKILEETGNQVTRMEWMVLSMLKLARIEAGAVSFEKRECQLSNVLDEVRGGIRYLTDMRSQKLVIDCPEDIKIEADPEWLTEAIINLVKNASDYSDENTTIDINVEQNSVFTRIYIRDHGIGMTEETMTHIFDRFYRASNDVNPNSVGIGLSLSKSIVEGMGGKIAVESTPGEGSVFKIQF